jgi:hypothetical protein
MADCLDANFIDWQVAQVFARLDIGYGSLLDGHGISRVHDE